MSISIKNLRNERPVYEYQVRVDRSSVLGNPFYMQTERQRDEVCDKYAEYFKQQLFKNQAFVNELQRLVTIYKRYGKLELFCWCAPKRCHAETIREFIIKAVDKEFALCRYSGCEAASTRACTTCTCNIYSEPDCIRDATGLDNLSEDEIARLSGYIPYEDGGY